MSKLFCDWVAGVIPFDMMGVEPGFMAVTSDAQRFAALFFHDQVKEACTPHFGYTQAWSLASGATIQFCHNRQEMGINVIYPGQALQVREWQGVLARILETGHVTRLDVTIDVLDPSFDIDELYNLIGAGQATTKARKLSFVQSNTGKTLYVGDRASEKMLRIYDKGGEQGNETGVHWRIEAELKGKTATSTGKRLLENTAEGCGVFKAILDCPSHRGYTSAVNATPSQFAFQTDKRRRDTLAWLFGLVARTMADQESMNPGTLDQFNLTVKQMLDRS